MTAPVHVYRIEVTMPDGKERPFSLRDDALLFFHTNGAEAFARTIRSLYGATVVVHRSLPVVWPGEEES